MIVFFIGSAIIPLIVQMTVHKVSDKVLELLKDSEKDYINLLINHNLDL